MPLFSFLCEDHGEFEVLRNSIPDSGHHECPTCGVPAPFVWPLTVMRPDSLQSARYVPGHGIIESASRLTRIMKNQHQTPIGNRDEREAMKKMAEAAAKARDAKFDQESREFMRAKMAEHGLLDADGNLKPEAHKPLSEISLVRTDDDRVKP